MPLAVALRLDDAAAAPVLAMWRVLAESGVDDDCLRLGYPPHVTLAVWPEEAPVGPLDAAVARCGAEWGALPVAFAGFGVFPGTPAVVWAAPVVTETLLARQAALIAAVPGAPPEAHWRPGHWVPHVTLGRTDAPSRVVEVLAPLWRGPLSGRLDRLELVRFRPVSVLRGLPLGCFGASRPCWARPPRPAASGAGRGGGRDRGSEDRYSQAVRGAQEIPQAICIRMLSSPVARRGNNQASEADLSFVVVKYQYSTSSDRVLNQSGTWKGQVPGRSLATVMSELRRVHRCATNIFITEIEWRDEGGAGARAHGRGPTRTGLASSCRTC